jgi:catechol 2,3-dioxygenase-like lactoylglutathione lyase family enzyme
MQPTRLDHVAFWVADRDPIAARAQELFGMHVIDRQDDFTLLGADARRGKLTLFDADGPRDRGVFRCVGLRVADLGRAGAPAEPVDVGEGIVVRVVERPTEVDFDLDHVVLATADPRATAAEYRRYGFEAGGDVRVRVGDELVEFAAGDATAVERPLLNHLAVLVHSADAHRSEAERAGIGVDSFVDASNTRAVFLRAPDGVRIEYVEHKASFSLA